MENAQKVPLFCFFRVFSPFLNRFSWLRYPNVRLEKLSRGIFWSEIPPGQWLPCFGWSGSDWVLVDPPAGRGLRVDSALGEKNTPPPPYGIGLTFRDGHFDTSTMKIGWERANLEKLGRIFLPSGCQDSPCTGDARFPCISVLGQPPSRLAWRKEKPKFVQDFLECA